MSRYNTHIRQQEGCLIVELQDMQRDDLAQLVPEIGGNLFRFRSEGKEILSAPSIAALQQFLFKYGTPILFPPNRVQNGTIPFGGRIYQLPINEPPDRHLHGELLTRSWEVVDKGGSEAEGAYVVIRFRFADHPDILAYFPHSLVFTVAVRLREGRLDVEGTIVNEGSDEAPFAFGLHPYFHVPYHQKGRLVLSVPAAREWPITNLTFVTGLPAETGQCEKLREGIDLRTIPPLGASLFELLEGENRTCRLTVEEEGYTIAYQVGRSFPFLVLFRPDWSEAFSLEPYTYVTDAFNLPYEPALTGARGIGPGEEIFFETGMWIEPLML